MGEIRQVLVTGGAGYVGAVLVPKMLASGYKVKVLDLYIYGDSVLEHVQDHPNLQQIKGDIRDQSLLEQAMRGCQTVIHLACISNDPSFELDPTLGRSINYDAFTPMVEIAKGEGVERFIYASSSSVYGLKDTKSVDETMSLEPLTDYSTYKALCEEILLRSQSPKFIPTILRPATVCGYSPRQRLDVIVNILANHAVNTGTIKVLGGDQMRPNIHIKDMIDAYLLLIQAPIEAVSGQVFNVGYENRTVRELAGIVRSVVGEETVELITVPSDDMRSYHISSEKIAQDVGFRPKHTIEEAVLDLTDAFQSGLLPDSLTDSRYFNVKRMREVALQ